MKLLAIIWWATLVAWHKVRSIASSMTVGALGASAMPPPPPPFTKEDEHD